MRILITNDDGIHAPGLAVLERIARTLSDNVTVVAPETDQSGVSHCLSLSDPLRLRQIEAGRYAVNGTPTDCIIMGCQHILKETRPDLILSGVNRGQNVADDVTYSGTLAAAMEGTLHGVRSIGLSQAYGVQTRQAPMWDCAETHAPGILRQLLSVPFAPGLLYNVNFPDCAPGEVLGVSVTRQGRRDQDGLVDVVERADFRQNAYFWLAPRREKPSTAEGTDVWAILNNRISVTPLKLDLTHEAALDHTRTLFDSM